MTHYSAGQKDAGAMLCSAMAFLEDRLKAREALALQQERSDAAYALGVVRQEFEALRVGLMKDMGIGDGSFR